MKRLGLLLSFIFVSLKALGARAGEIMPIDTWLQLDRLKCIEDTAVRYALAGALITGVSTGLLGSFLVVRRLSMVGDTLSHAVLPGLVGGFLWAQGKDPWALFFGAWLAGLLGIALVSWVQKSSFIKEDAALGLVLSGFYAVGICLLSIVQRLPMGQKSGLDKVLFGQAAALGPADLSMMTWSLGAALGLIIVFYKEFVALSFDSGFIRALGWPLAVFEGLFMGVLASVIVTSLKTSGVVLVSAMLVIPASTAYLLTQKFRILIFVSIGISIVACFLGVAFSFLKPGLPTGPCMVVVAGFIFICVWLFEPRQGLLSKCLYKFNFSKKIAIENSLKAVYHILESKAFTEEFISLEEFSIKRKESIQIAVFQFKALINSRLADWSYAGKPLNGQYQRLCLTPAGWARACEIVRNHRLWELYLTHAANYSPDHVHDDAEKIEHILGEDTVRQIESRLNYPQRDPHGKLIPSLADLENPNFSKPPWLLEGGRDSGYRPQGL